MYPPPNRPAVRVEPKGLSERMAEAQKSLDASKRLLEAAGAMSDAGLLGELSAVISNRTTGMMIRLQVVDVKSWKGALLMTASARRLDVEEYLSTGKVTLLR